MKITTQKTKAKLVEMFCAEAKKLGGATSANQKRFFSVAIEHGKTMEPAGPLAGLSR
ncbi:hypothetical protein [Pseudomonas canadensis]|jgi:hypothetical protein|uniref:hypothetical protein n=1 Tax=Pseudomonas canadensis TaxID=915099 RepID=UPI002892E1F2|nr:hypothetical protein [Pseudomonas canadensis]WNJ85448.1 hypothetical protein RMQ99_02370 [Pseudomonas canadensis]